MKATKGIGAYLVVLLGILLLTSSGYATGYQDGSLGICQSCWQTLFSIEDPDHVNLTDQKALWDYRDTGEPEITQAPQNTGAYYHVYVAVTLGGKLLDFSDIKEVRVRHLETEREFSMIGDPCLTFLNIGQYWDLLLQPADWMFDGTWHITMIYKGSDRLLHRQTIDAPAGPRFFPAEPKDISIDKQDGNVKVSWTGIGTPSSSIRYRVRVYVDEFCAQDPGVGFSYSPEGRVSFTFPIPPTGVVRLENREYVGPGDVPFARAIKIFKVQ